MALTGFSDTLTDEIKHGMYYKSELGLKGIGYSRQYAVGEPCGLWH